MSDHHSRHHENRGHDHATVNARAAADRAAEQARERAERERRRLDEERERRRREQAAADRRAAAAAGLRTGHATGGRAPMPSSGAASAVGDPAVAGSPGPAPRAPRPPDPSPPPAVLLRAGWEGAGRLERHPGIPELYVETSPATMRGDLRLAVEWPSRFAGRRFVPATDIPGRWVPLRPGGTTVPAQVRRLDARTVELRWTESRGFAASAGSGHGPGPAGAVVGVLAGAAAAWVARRLRDVSEAAPPATGDGPAGRTG